MCVHFHDDRGTRIQNKHLIKTNSFRRAEGCRFWMDSVLSDQFLSQIWHGRKLFDDDKDD